MRCVLDKHILSPDPLHILCIPAMTSTFFHFVHTIFGFYNRQATKFATIATHDIRFAFYFYFVCRTAVYCIIENFFTIPLINQHYVI